MSHVNLIVAVQIKLKNKQAVIDAIKEMQGPSQAEEGCIKYDYAISSNELSKIFLMEIWKDRTVFEAHKKTKHFIDGNIKLAQLCENVTLHEVEWNVD
ncbi:putative quinol monooxygenase [Rosenbergiella australiborealis]|uniref:Antibiotic biosynthesis monooxygenase n=1 Tax=Rosenbergiella australiborealis TaxID=1544696 RepID=A0ABS5T7D5_9GAMM|nr:putative quinol monooxygenase [Rosenbergiella australiborealis]MBT0728037.1 antibiotic biosynthesis monooxygenase [Rosenbergiella australiborealis]